MPIRQLPVNRVPEKVPSKVAVFAEPFGIYSDDAQPINDDVTRIKISPIKYFMIISRQSGFLILSKSTGEDVRMQYREKVQKNRDFLKGLIFIVRPPARL